VKGTGRNNKEVLPETGGQNPDIIEKDDLKEGDMTTGKIRPIRAPFP